MKSFAKLTLLLIVAFRKKCWCCKKV